MTSEPLACASTLHAGRGTSTGNQLILVFAIFSSVFSLGLCALLFDSDSFARLADAALGIFGGGAQLIAHLVFGWIYTKKCRRLTAGKEKVLLTMLFANPVLTAMAATLPFFLPSSGGFGVC